jgi:deoxyribonuclease-2
MTIAVLDENGKQVDWWFIYKVPKLLQSAQTDSASGYEYVYFDKNSTTVKRSPYRLDQQGQGALNRTLATAGLENPSKTTGWILYNDE